MKRLQSSGSQEAPESKRERAVMRFTINPSNDSIVATAAHGKTVVFSIPYHPLFDNPEGAVFNAMDACAKYIQPLPGILVAFRRNLLNPTTLGRFDMFAKLMGLEKDNPGQLMLTLMYMPARHVRTAYMLALSECMGVNPAAPDGRSELVKILALICKVFGCSYCTLPTLSPAAPINPIYMLLDAIIAGASMVFGPPASVMDFEYRAMAKILRIWHAPSYIREKSPKAAAVWDLALPLERLAAFTQ